MGEFETNQKYFMVSVDKLQHYSMFNIFTGFVIHCDHLENTKKQAPLRDDRGQRQDQGTRYALCPWPEPGFSLTASKLLLPKHFVSTPITSCTLTSWSRHFIVVVITGKPFWRWNKNTRCPRHLLLCSTPSFVVGLFYYSFQSTQESMTS